MTEPSSRPVRPLGLVAVGGFAGATVRHGVTTSLPTAVYGTLVVNVVGSFLLGLLLYEGRTADIFTPETRLLVGTGFLSSFTTYSTFAAQTAALSPKLAVANVTGNYVLGFLAVVLAQYVGRWTW